MSDLKFSCSACGQHIQCDASHAGENLPCPACAHLVRVPADAPIVIKPPPSAMENVPVTEEKASYTPAESTAEKYGETVPTLEENFLAETETPPSTSIPITEREQQIAAARASHTVQIAQPVKPRLSFILSGGAAPPPQENESAVHSDTQKNPDHSPHETKALHE